MLYHIIKKELLENFLSLRFAITVILSFLVIGASVGILGKEYIDDMYDYSRNREKHRNEIEEKDHPWRIIYRGVMVDKPVSAMSIFNKGIDDTGRYAKIFGHKEAEYYTKAGENPVTFLFPAIDLLFFISVIMSLLAIVFSYDGVSGEKVHETLKLMVSYPVPRDIIIIGKWIGGFLCLMLPFIMAVSASLIILFAVIREVTFSGGDYLRLCLLICLSGGFVSVIYTFGLVISANTEHPSTSIAVLLLIWIIFILIIPNISPSVASLFVENINVQELEGRKRKLMHDAWETYRDKARKYRRKHNYGWGDPEYRIYRDKLRKERYKQIRRGLENINRDFRLTMERNMRLTRWISRLSPLASLEFSAGLLCETGPDEDYNFRRAVDEYERRLMTFCFDEWIESTRARYDESKEWKFEPEKAPRFNYSRLKNDTLASQVSDILIDIGLLVCWNLLFIIGAYVSFLRYDVT